MLTLDTIRAAPKVVLHDHLDGGLRPRTVIDLAAEYGYSNRDQRHRFNSWFVWNAPFGVDVNARYSYRSHQPKSITATGVEAARPVSNSSWMRAAPLTPM